MKINEKRMLFAYVLLVLQTILASTKSHFYLLQIIIILITMLLFRKYYIKIFSMVIKKIKDTPAKYPRKAGTPSREPLK